MNWNASKHEYDLANAVAVRANKMVPEYSVRDAEMDIIAAHKNGCPLKLSALLAAPDFDFIHDVLGIRSNLNRGNGQLRNCFDPRCSVPQELPR